MSSSSHNIAFGESECECELSSTQNFMPSPTDATWEYHNREKKWKVAAGPLSLLRPAAAEAQAKRNSQAKETMATKAVVGRGLREAGAALKHASGMEVCVIVSLFE